MIRLFLLEVKSLFKARSTQILIAIGIIIPIMIGVLFISGVQSDRILNNGEIEIVKGVEAVYLNQEYDSVYSGQITIDKLEKARLIYNESYDKAKERTIITKSILEIETLFGVIESLKFPLNKDMVIVKWNERDIPVEYAHDFYTLRDNMLKKYTESIDNERIAKRILDDESRVKKPFFYGAGLNDWGYSIEWLTMLMFVISVITTMVCSTTFTDIKEDRRADIISTTEGYSEFFYAKIGANISLILLIYVLIIGLYVSIVYHFLGNNALYSSIQIDMPFSPASYRLGDALFLEILAGLIGVLSLGMLNIVISIIVKSSKTALILGFALIFIYGVLTIFIRPESKVINTLISIFPMGVSQVFFQLPFPNYLDFRIVVIWEPIFIILMGALQIVLYFAIGRITWNRR